MVHLDIVQCFKCKKNVMKRYCKEEEKVYGGVPMQYLKVWICELCQ